MSFHVIARRVDGCAVPAVKHRAEWPSVYGDHRGGGVRGVCRTGRVRVQATARSGGGGPSDPDRMGHWRLSVFPIRDLSGTFTGAGVTALDVTEAVEAAQARDTAKVRQAELLAEQRTVALTLQRALPSPARHPEVETVVR